MQSFSPELIQQTIERLEAQEAERYAFSRVEQFVGAVAIQDLADSLRISTDVVRRYKRDGLTLNEADSLACRLYVHAVSIWPEWIEIPPMPTMLLDAVEEYRRTHKRCQMCENWKERRLDFHKRAASSDGLARYCRECSRIYEETRKARRQEQEANV